jgi:cellulose synthase/poly-beta-1,6-N-acetylglucosamine synthase-like glycosyltransferase
MIKQDIEIPLPRNRHFRYRFFEALPGLISWFVLFLPLILSAVFGAYVAVFFILGYLLLWLAKSVGLDIRAIQGYKTIKYQEKLPWQDMLNDIQAGKTDGIDRPKWHARNIERLKDIKVPIQPGNIIHALIVATYNESREILEPTLKSILRSEYDMKKVILVIAYEERGGPEIEKQTMDLLAEYGHSFYKAMAVKHPENIPDEVIGKGGNISYAGRELNRYLEKENIQPINVIVTTLDSDNRPHPKYLAALSYMYSVCFDPIHTSFQPVPMFTNNIWDAPAPSRVIATGNSFWMTVSSMRPHILRNFSAHAQSMQTLIDTDYWSVRTIVEDGHQYWRTFFRYDGNHEVYPIYLPIYQDAVLARTFRKTLRAQFIQLRRWAWGASDVAYVLETGFFKKNKVNKFNLTFKFLQLLEGHISWATAPLLLAFSAFIPAIINPQNYEANLLPIIVSRLQTIALCGIFITLLFSFKTLPPKPERYNRRRTFFMVVQWVYLPVTTITFNAFSALVSQTRLIFGRYIDKFDVTEKAVIVADKDNNTKVIAPHDSAS